MSKFCVYLCMCILNIDRDYFTEGEERQSDQDRERHIYICIKLFDHYLNHFKC